MGMISFLKEAGEKLFGKSPEVAAVIAEPTNEEKVAAAPCMGAYPEKFLQLLGYPSLIFCHNVIIAINSFQFFEFGYFVNVAI